MSAIDCERCAELLPDLALGIAETDERDEVLAHIAGCVRCHNELDQLTSAADMLLLATEPQEPPAGFESAVLQAFVPVTARRRRRWALVAGAAAAVLLAFAAGIGVSRVRDTSGPVAAPASAPPAAVSDPVVLTGQFSDPEGRAMGQAVAHDAPSWLTVALDPSAPRGTYTVVCDYEAGDSFTAGTLTVTTPGGSTWSTTVPIPLSDLHRVRLVNTSGGPNLEASVHAA